MNTALASLSQPGFELTAELASEGIDVRFVGTADMHAIEPLDLYLASVHSVATERRVKRVRVDFRKLEFMNSSCFKSFVSWIGNVQDLAPSTRYQIEFQSNSQMHWQRRSLNALRCFAMDVVAIES
jgi:hypothetical protein